MKRHIWIGALSIAALMNSASAADLERADPGSVGMNSAALAKLKARMGALVEKGDRAGIVYGIARNGKIVALEAIGKRNVELDLPMETDTQFRIYSMTRAFSGTATLNLIDAGKIGLDDPVSKYIPEIAKMKTIKRDGVKPTSELEDQKPQMSVRHLLTYTSGLGYAPNWPEPFKFDQSNVLNPDVSIADGMANLATHPLLYQPGAKWHYGFSGDVLGRVIEVASGQPLDAFFKSRITDKLGMKKTAFWITPEDNAAHNLAEVYGKKEAGDKLENMTAKATPLSHFARPGKLFSGGGGLVSTVPDYMRIAQMLLNGGILNGERVLAEPTVRAMLSRQTTPDQGTVYWYAPGQFTSVVGWAWGYSIGVRPEGAGPDVPGKPGEVGWSGLANTFFMINREQNIVGVVMAQYLGPNGNDLSAIFREGVYEAAQK